MAGHACSVDFPADGRGMSDDRDGARQADYRAARIGAAAALTGALILLLFADVLPPFEYEVSPTVLGVLSTMILLLLAVEAADFLRGGKR